MIMSVVVSSRGGRELVSIEGSHTLWALGSVPSLIAHRGWEGAIEAAV